MKINIKEIKSELSRNIVVFSTEFGSAKAIWQGDTPRPNLEYFVEMEISNILTWGRDIIRVDECSYSVGMEGDVLYFIGYIESIDDDGYTVIRLGDSIIAIEVDGNPFPQGVFVKVLANEVSLFNVNY